MLGIPCQGPVRIWCGTGQEEGRSCLRPYARLVAHIVIAEDDPKQAALIRLYAENDGHVVTVVGDGRAALEQVRSSSPDVLVLDVMLPRVDGLDVCRILRAESDVPILMLTARSTEEDLLLGLDLGADDYVTKPYSPRVLMGRLRALVRRSRASAGDVTADVGGIIAVGTLEVDTVRHEVRSRGADVPLTRGEFALLETLAAEPGRAFTREQLMSDLYGTDRYVSRRAVDMHVMNLRRKLSEMEGPEGRHAKSSQRPGTRPGEAASHNDTHEPVEVATVYGVGYKLVVRTSRG